MDDNRRIMEICNQNIYGDQNYQLQAKKYDYPTPSLNQSNNRANEYQDFQSSVRPSSGYGSSTRNSDVPKIRYRHIEDFQPKN